MFNEKKLSGLSQTHIIFILVALFFGVIFAKITPPLWGADEGQHFFRSYQISQGGFFQKKVKSSDGRLAGGYIPESFANLDELKKNDIGNNIPTNTFQVDSISEYQAFSRTSVRKEKEVISPYGNIIYPSITYVAPSIGIFVGNLFNATALSLLFSARIASLILYIILIVYALYVLRKYSVKWIVFVVSLLPMSLYQASVVSADSFLMGLSLIFFSQIYIIFHSKERISKILIFLLALVASLLTIVKPPYVILVLILLVLPLKKSVSPRDRTLIKIIIPCLSLVIAAFCIINVRELVVAPLPNTSLNEQLHWIILHPFDYINVLVNSVATLDWVPQIIGLFGTSFILIPGAVTQLIIASLALTAFIETKDKITNHTEIIKNSSMIYMGATLVLSLLIVTTLYLTWTPVGAVLVSGIQGRYFLPLVPFILFGVRMLTKSRLWVDESRATYCYGLLVIITLSISVLWYSKILY